MAVNFADGTMFASVVVYPIAAGVGAAHSGAGWLTVLFLPVGLAVGIGITYVGRKLVYSVTGFGMNRISKISSGWVQQIVALPLFLLYFILPLAIVWGGVFGAWAGSTWLVKHVL